MNPAHVHCFEPIPWLVGSGLALLAAGISGDEAIKRFAYGVAGASFDGSPTHLSPAQGAEGVGRTHHIKGMVSCIRMQPRPLCFATAPRFAWFSLYGGPASLAVRITDNDGHTDRRWPVACILITASIGVESAISKFEAAGRGGGGAVDGWIGAGTDHNFFLATPLK
jgi:hypothetical protein